MDEFLQQKTNEVTVVKEYVKESKERLNNLKENKVMFFPLQLLAYIKEAMDYLAVYNNKLISIKEQLEDSYINKEDNQILLARIDNLLKEIENQNELYNIKASKERKRFNIIQDEYDYFNYE